MILIKLLKTLATAQGDNNMKKVIILVLMMMTVGMFAKEYTWGTTTRWNNNYPEVVKTMPGVQAALKEWNITEYDFTELEETDYETVEVVTGYAKRVASTKQEMGQLIYFNDESDLFVIVNFDIVDGENTYVGRFAAKIEILSNYLMD